MSWIKETGRKEATGSLAKIYDQLSTPDGDIDRILRVHSLMPKALKAHLMLYRSIMFSQTSLSRSTREMIAVVVSSANKCSY